MCCARKIGHCWNSQTSLLKHPTPLLKQLTSLLKQPADTQIPSLPVICDSGRVFFGTMATTWRRGYMDYPEDSTLSVSILTISFYGRTE